MITLTIKNEDGSTYWVEHFNKQEHADKWLAEEMTRPYWNVAFVVESVETLPPVPSDAEIAAKAADDAAHVQVANFLKGLKKSDLVDVPTLANAVMKIIKHLRADV